MTQQHTAVPFWRDVRVLTVISQIVFVIILALAAGFFYSNLSSAMRQRGLVAGFEFLQRESAFEIGETLIDYKPSDTYARAFTVGLAQHALGQRRRHSARDDSWHYHGRGALVQQLACQSHRRGIYRNYPQHALARATGVYLFWRVCQTAAGARQL